MAFFNEFANFFKIQTEKKIAGTSKYFFRNGFAERDVLAK